MYYSSHCIISSFSMSLKMYIEFQNHNLFTYSCYTKSNTKKFQETSDKGPVVAEPEGEGVLVPVGGEGG